MKQVTVRKEVLKTILQDNLKKHVEEYKEALEGYKEKALEALKEQIIEIEKGSFLNWNKLNLKQPQTYEKEYKRAIGMLEMSCDSNAVTITAEEYDSYVLDEWNWKNDWVFSNTQYTKHK